MESWKSDLVDKIIDNYYESITGKTRLKCPYCDSIDYITYDFNDDGTTKENVSAAVMMGAFVYIPHLKLYGEFCHCRNCGESFYSCSSEDRDDLEYIKVKDLNSKRVFIEKIQSNNISIFINKNFYDALMNRRLGK